MRRNWDKGERILKNGTDRRVRKLWTCLREVRLAGRRQAGASEQSDSEVSSP
jgi:hypothetical protein